MLDPITYRTNEQLAKAMIPTWRIAQTHNVDFFERVGFPVRVSSFRDLGQLVDTMQENRFDAYMKELGGLTAQEHDLFIEVCCDVVQLQAVFFPSRRPALPLSTMMSALVLYRKMLGFGAFNSVLEIGPGCGYLSFFLRRHNALKNFSEIEACESLYLYQNLVNLHCFGARFEERAFLPPSTRSVDYFVDTSANDFEIPPLLRVERKPALCTHYPWWRIGELVSEERSFDIVTSNANLLEFNPAALNDYLGLIKRVLKPNGALLAQCLGWPAHGNMESLLDKMYARGFAPLLYMREKVPARYPGHDVLTGVMDAIRGKGGHEVVFPVNNALFVREGHPLYAKYKTRPSQRNLEFVAPESIVDAMFFRRPSERRTYSRNEIVEEIEKRAEL